MSNDEVETSVAFLNRLNDDQLRVLAYLGVVRTLRDTCEALVQMANKNLSGKFNGESDFERGVRELLCDPREEAGPREPWSSDFALGADGARTLLAFSKNMMTVDELVEHLHHLGVETGAGIAAVLADLKTQLEEGK